MQSVEVFVDAKSYLLFVLTCAFVRFNASRLFTPAAGMPNPMAAVRQRTRRCCGKPKPLEGGRSLVASPKTAKKEQLGGEP